MISLKSIAKAVGVVLLLPVLAVAGTVMASLFTYGWYDADPSDLPRHASVVAILDLPTGESCRLVPLERLAVARDAVGMRLGLTQVEVEECREAFAQFSGAPRWQGSLEQTDDRMRRVTLNVEGAPRDIRFSILQGFGESSLTTRYRIDAQDAPTDVQFRSSSMGQGVGAVGFGGAAGVVAWLILVVVLLLRMAIRRRSQS